MDTRKCSKLPFFSCLYTSLLFLTIVLEEKVLYIGSFKVLSGTLILPLTYVISDIITEVYGYRKTVTLIWNSIIILYICSFLIVIILHISSDNSIPLNHSYDQVFGLIPGEVFTYSIAAVISMFLNAYIISRSKILLNGRYFWVRSLSATAVGEAIFILTWGFLQFYSEFGFDTLLKLMLASYVTKLMYNLVSIFPATIIMQLLKKHEGIDTYDLGVDFNPFKGI